MHLSSSCANYLRCIDHPNQLGTPEVSRCPQLSSHQTSNSSDAYLVAPEAEIQIANLKFPAGCLVPRPNAFRTCAIAILIAPPVSSQLLNDHVSTLCLVNTSASSTIAMQFTSQSRSNQSWHASSPSLRARGRSIKAKTITSPRLGRNNYIKSSTLHTVYFTFISSRTLRTADTKQYSLSQKSIRNGAFKPPPPPSVVRLPLLLARDAAHPRLSRYQEVLARKERRCDARLLSDIRHRRRPTSAVRAEEAPSEAGD